jgi:hypothetical protein
MAEKSSQRSIAESMTGGSSGACSHLNIGHPKDMNKPSVAAVAMPAAGQNTDAVHTAGAAVVR